MLIDLHVHTPVSPCGELEIADIIKHAKSRGLDGVCITDHMAMDAQNSIKEGVQANGLCVLLGMEYDTSDGDFLIFGPFEDIPLDLTAIKLLKLVEDCGGAAIAAHPFRKARPAQEYLVRDGHCRIIESLNGRNTRAEDGLVRHWRDKYSLAEVGGSDAHTLDELGAVATRFERPIRSRSDLISALNKNLCQAQWSRKYPLASSVERTK